MSSYSFLNLIWYMKPFTYSSIKWNFTKFLIDRNGIPQHRYSPRTDPLVSIDFYFLSTFRFLCSYLKFELFVNLVLWEWHRGPSLKLTWKGIQFEPSFPFILSLIIEVYWEDICVAYDEVSGKPSCGLTSFWCTLQIGYTLWSWRVYSITSPLSSASLCPSSWALLFSLIFNKFVNKDCIVWYYIKIVQTVSEINGKVVLVVNYHSCWHFRSLRSIRLVNIWFNLGWLLPLYKIYILVFVSVSVGVTVKQLFTSGSLLNWWIQKS